ncbi:WYL domain-containing protein [Providencia stuartii]|nr:WYL domain-containing protein [Providencia stuartii]
MPRNTVLKLENHSHAQRERLAFIDFCLQYHGSVGRSELMAHFGTAVASSTRDFTLYRELAHENLILRHENKRYYRTDTYQPLFYHEPHAALKTLIYGFGDGLSVTSDQSGFCEDAPDLISPPQNILATISRAISQEQAVQMTYQSLNSGASDRVVVPHCIINNGQHWHIRGYCRKLGEFRDFVCNRITSVSIDKVHIAKHEQQTSDAEWNEQLTLELIPHPCHSHPEAIALNFNMSRQNNQPVRQLSIRAARAGYLLRYWNVDCSPDHRLPEQKYHLWLRNHNILEHCANAVLAPGYVDTHGKAAVTIK